MFILAVKCDVVCRASPPSDEFFWPVIVFGALLASDFVDGVLARRLGSNPWGASLGEILWFYSCAPIS